MSSIGIDIGGTKTALVLLDEQGKLLQKNLWLTEKTVEKTLQKIQENIQGLFPSTLGVGIAGQTSSGIIHFVPNLGWKNVSLAKQLEASLNLPVHILNDVQAATFAEWKQGAGKGSSDLVCLFIGTGVGGGIISQGRLIQGAQGIAGEAGHMSVSIDGPACTCGNRGCLETILGGWAIAKRGGKQTAKEVIAAFKNQDEKAGFVLHVAKQALIQAVTSLVNLLNPEKVILGGGIIEALPEWIEEVKKQVFLHALQASTKSLEISQATLGNLSSAIGAALFAQEAQKHKLPPLKEQS